MSPPFLLSAVNQWHVYDAQFHNRPLPRTDRSLPARDRRLAAALCTTSRPTPACSSWLSSPRC